MIGRHGRTVKPTDSKSVDLKHGREGSIPSAGTTNSEVDLPQEDEGALILMVSIKESVLIGENIRVHLHRVHTSGASSGRPLVQLKIVAPKSVKLKRLKREHE